MKKENKLFEVINDIDGKYIHEAGYEKVEESYAEEMQSVGRSKIRFAPAARIAACLALAGAVAVPAVIFSSGNSLGMTPYQSGENNAAVEGTTDFSEENAASDPAEGNDPSDDEEKTNWLYIFNGEKNSPYSDAVREEIEAGIEEWNNMTKDYPVDKPYSEINQFDFALSGVGNFNQMFVHAPEGAEVRAVADGRVIFAGTYVNKSGANANIILIEHNPCVYTSYLWLDDNMCVESGDDVVRGQAIGSALRSPLEREGSGFCLGAYSHAPENSYECLVLIRKHMDDASLEHRTELVREWSEKDLVTPVENVPDGFEFKTAPLLTGGNSRIFIPVEKGTEIRTVDDGEVVYAGFYNVESEDWSYPGGGNLIAVKHNDAVYSVYYGVSDDIKVKMGDTLTAGQVIGYSDINADFYENGFVFVLNGVGEDTYQYVYTDYKDGFATMIDDAEVQTDTLSEGNFVTVSEKAEEDQEQKTEEEQEPLS